MQAAERSDSPPSRLRDRVIGFLCVVLFLDALGFAIIMPVLPSLIRLVTGADIGDAARLGGFLLFAYAGMQFLAAPFLGALSDRYGRRPVLLIALAGFAVDYCLMAFAPDFFWLIVARLLSGLSGATFPAANAAIIDVTKPEERARFFGLGGAAVGLGFVFGPVVGGVLGEIDTRLPFLVAAAVTAGACLYGAFFLPETLPADRRRPVTLGRANPFGALAAIGRSPAVLMVLGAIFLVQLASQSYVSIWAFYAIERFDWSPFFIALPIGFYGVLIAITQGLLTGPAIRRMGEPGAAFFSLGCGVVAYVVLALAAHPVLIYVGVFIGCGGAFAYPAMQAIMARRTPEDAQGELQGAVASSFGLTSIIGPIAMTQTFDAFTESPSLYLPGAPFFLSALLILLGVASLAAAMRPRAGS